MATRVTYPIQSTYRGKSQPTFKEVIHRQLFAIHRLTGVFTGRRLVIWFGRCRLANFQHLAQSRRAVLERLSARNRAPSTKLFIPYTHYQIKIESTVEGFNKVWESLYESSRIGLEQDCGNSRVLAIQCKWCKKLLMIRLKSTLIQVMAWCHQAAFHYLNQCWLGSLMTYEATRPQWVKLKSFFVTFNWHIDPEAPRGSIWHHRYWTSLAQIMAWCLMAPSHWMNQCWLSSTTSLGIQHGTV